MSKNNKKKDLLFNDSDDDDDNDNNDNHNVDEYDNNDRLKVNRSFASTYEKRERFKELQKAKSILGNTYTLLIIPLIKIYHNSDTNNTDDDDDDDSESSEEEDDDGALLSTTLDLDIVKTINAIRKKDPRIYDKNVKFFEDNDDGNDDDDENDDDKSSKKQTYKDVLRSQLLRDGPDIENESDNNNSSKKNKKSLAYDQEQENIRKEFLKSMNGDNIEDDEDGDNMLQVRKKSNAEIEKEEIELRTALEEMNKLSDKKNNTEVDKDTFLTNYISNKKWKFDKSYDISYNDDIDDDDDDENELDRMENFESKYNFRFEELLANDDKNKESSGMGLKNIQVVGHSRTIEGSVRRVDDKRKKQREEKLERKEKEKRQREAELRRLKNLKREELLSRIKKISKISGLSNLGLDENELDEDWDPEKYEKMMSKNFGDDYYGENDANIDEIMEGFDEDIAYDDYDHEDDDNIKIKLKPKKDKSKKKKKKNAKDDDDDIDDIDEYVETLDKKGKEEAAQLMDEYYKLDYEDVVGDIKTRFKYRQVEKDDFGLSTEEILMADDKDLNSFVGLKKLSAYYHHKDKDANKEYKLANRRKKLRSKIKENMKNAAEEEESTTVKSKSSKSENSNPITDENEDNDDDDDDTNGDKQVDSKKKRKRRKKRDDNSNSIFKSDEEISKVDPRKTIKEDKQVASKVINKTKEKRKQKDVKEETIDPKKARLNLYN